MCALVFGKGRKASMQTLSKKWGLRNSSIDRFLCLVLAGVVFLIISFFFSPVHVTIIQHATSFNSDTVNIQMYSKENENLQSKEGQLSPWQLSHMHYVNKSDVQWWQYIDSNGTNSNDSINIGNNSNGNITYFNNNNSETNSISKCSLYIHFNNIRTGSIFVNGFARYYWGEYFQFIVPRVVSIQHLGSPSVAM
ncbi:hypothetical protein RFI_14670, partial [Reticulomyxa filosa]